MEGNGRISEMMGSNTAQNRRDVPSINPKGIETATASANPIMTLRVEASTCDSNTPSFKVWMARKTTSVGEGRKMGSTSPKRHTISQIETKTTTDMQLISTSSRFLET